MNVNLRVLIYNYPNTYLNYLNLIISYFNNFSS